MRCNAVVMVVLLSMTTLSSCSSHLDGGLAEQQEEEGNWTEFVRVKPLLDARVMVHMRFHTHAQRMPRTHFNLIPMALGLVLNKYGVRSLKLSLGRGRWWVESWGLPPVAAPEGLAVSATFDGDKRSVDARWRGLMHSLSSLLCASMGFVVKDHTNYVEMSDWERSGTLPREAVCTENLTPWIDLLPCRDVSGIGSLITPRAVFDSNHHFMLVSFDILQGGRGVALTQELLYVSSAKRERWTHAKIFGESVAGVAPCELAQKSTLFIDDSAFSGSQNQVLLQGTPAGLYTLTRSSAPMLVELILPTTRSHAIITAGSPVSIFRHLSGRGQERGSVVTFLLSQTNEWQELRLVETAPWYIRAYFHTLRVSVNGLPLDGPLSKLVRRIDPSSVRGAPALLELDLTLPPHGNVSISWDFSKAFLRVSEHPPDAHHGLHLPAAALVNVSTGEVLLYSDVLVSVMPLPDFSMPFNVVALSGIILGFYFGAILRAVTARYSDLKRGKSEVVQSQRPIAKLARLLLRLIDGE